MPLAGATPLWAGRFRLHGGGGPVAPPPSRRGRDRARGGGTEVKNEPLHPRGALPAGVNLWLMSRLPWPLRPYQEWQVTCDTLHAHTQVLGKLAVQLAPPEPQLQHAALRLTARGRKRCHCPPPTAPARSWPRLTCGRTRRWLSTVMARPNGSADPAPRGGGGHPRRSDRAAPHGRLRGLDPTPQEVAWTVPLDQDDEHAHYDPGQVDEYFAAATQAALILAAYRAPFRGRSTPVNAWWARSTWRSACSPGFRPGLLGRLHHAQRHGRPGGGRRLVAG